MADIFVQRFQELGGKLILNDGVEKISCLNRQGYRSTAGIGNVICRLMPLLPRFIPKILLELLDADALDAVLTGRRILN